MGYIYPVIRPLITCDHPTAFAQHLGATDSFWEPYSICATSWCNRFVLECPTAFAQHLGATDSFWNALQHLRNILVQQIRSGMPYSICATSWCNRFVLECPTTFAQ